MVDIGRALSEGSKAEDLDKLFFYLRIKSALTPSFELAPGQKVAYSTPLVFRSVY